MNANCMRGVRRVGEIAAIQNCTAVLTDPAGPYKLTPKQAQAAFADLSLYTNAESCPMVRPPDSNIFSGGNPPRNPHLPPRPFNLRVTPYAPNADPLFSPDSDSLLPQCASAIRWSGFREYIYGTSIATLIERGWAQIRIPSIDVFERSFDLPNPSRLLAGVLTNETNPLFSWQFDPGAPCPAGCARVGTTCRLVEAAGGA